MDYGAHLASVGARVRVMAEEIDPLVETGHLEGAELVVVAYGTPGRYIRFVVNELRQEGLPVGFVRPITLWPFPTAAVAAAAAHTRAVAVYELNTGQMFDDVRLAVLGRRPVHFIGGLSFDGSGFGIAPDLDVDILSRPHSTDPGPRREGACMSLPVIPTDRPPARAARLVDDFTPPLILPGEHHMCPGCGEPAAMRSTVEIIDELGLTHRALGVFGIGCYTGFSGALDVEVVQALHGRAPSLATGVKRAKPETIVFTVQGDGDMVNEGLQEVIHTAARGENITCILLNNGVFGETGGHMTATTVLGQRTKNTLDGRDAARHGFPILISDLLSRLEGSAYVARGATNSAGNVARTRRMLKKAFEAQAAGLGFTFVEVLTMCPTGWFIETEEAPDYLAEKLATVHALGVLKDLSADG